MPLKKAGIHWFLTDEEVAVARNELDDLRKTADYEPDKWCLSGLNRKPEALGLALPDHMPKKVLVRDITLRTAEQASGVILSHEDRLRLLRALLEVGITSFELTYFARQRADELREQVDLIRRVNPDAEIEAGQITTVESIDLMASIGANLVSIKCPPCFATAPLRPGAEVPKAAWEGKDWRTLARPPMNIKELAARNRSLIQHAEKRGMKTCAYLSSLNYATPEFIEEYTYEMTRAGVHSILLGDGPGATAPHGFAYAVSIIKRIAPEMKVVIHAHNSFNLGVARCLAGVHAGADVVEVSINGAGSYAGQVDLAHVAAALELLYRVDTGLKLDQFTALRRLGEEVFGYPVSRDHSITGERYFTPEDTLINFDPWIHTSVEPAIFGNRAIPFFSQKADVWDMAEKLTELNIPVEKPEVEAILKEVKAELIARKREPTDEEIRATALRVKTQMTGQING
ncbi:hypothetical protein [Paraburkholderia caffeinilytica]|uniref:hypothetical protein n=1 Tax=Paraburkholderia caffeinilytica TaxID=1761016 RepID=UPI0038BA9276